MMNVSALAKSAASLAAGARRALGPAGTLVRKALLLDLDSEYIAAGKTLCVSIEHRDGWGLSAAHGTRVLSRLKLVASRYYPLGREAFPPPAEFAAACLQAVRDLGAAGAELVLSLPRDWTVVQVIEFPSTAKDHLTEVVFYELDRLTPFSPGEAYFDFRLLGEEGGKLRVMVAAVKSDLLDPYLDVLRKLGIPCSRVTFQLAGVMALLEGGRGADAVVLNVQASGYDGARLRKGRVEEIFGGHFKDAAGAADEIASRLNQMMAPIRSAGGSPQIFMTSRECEPAGLGPKLPIPVRDLQAVYPAWLGKGGGSNQPDSGLSVFAAGALLESLRPMSSGARTNLLSRGQRSVSKPSFLLSAVLLIAIACLGVYYLTYPIFLGEKRLQEIDQQIRARKTEVAKAEQLRREVESLEKEIRAIDDFKNRGPMAIVLLRELTLRLPKDIWLERVRIGETHVDIEGYANSASQLLSKLEGSDHFQKASFVSAIVKNARTNNDRFVINMEIKGVKKPEEPKDHVQPKKK